VDAAPAVVMNRPDEHVPRTLGPLAVSPELAQLLRMLRHRAAVSQQPEVDADRVRAVEIGVAFRFSDDLLAVYAAAVPLLTDKYHLRLDAVVAHTGELRDGHARGDLIGIGAASPQIKLCIEKKLHDPARTQLALYDVDTKTIETIDLLAWLHQRAGELPEAQSAAPPFVPVLVRVLPGGSSGRRVRHAAFGEGKVYVEIGTGPMRKVKVDFPGVGLKLLQSRLLEYLEVE
jgi:hypothetical protein